MHFITGDTGIPYTGLVVARRICTIIGGSDDLLVFEIAMTTTTFPLTTHCLICETPLNAHQRALRRPVCQRADCQWRFSQLGRNGRCEVCGQALERITTAVGVCDTPLCQRTHHERQGHRDQAALRERARQLRDRSAPALGIENPETYPVQPIPAFEARLVNLPQQRKRAFRDRLTQIISEAVSRPGPPPAPDRSDPGRPDPSQSSELGPVLGSACASCKGHCCRNGGDHAYIEPATIRRYLADHPDQRPRQVLAAYLSRLNNKTYEHSCIFHGAKGCALPRELRSDTCNRHFCDGLRTFQRQHDPAGPARGFFLSVSGRTVKAAVFADRDSSRSVPSLDP